MKKLIQLVAVILMLVLQPNTWIVVSQDINTSDSKYLMYLISLSRSNTSGELRNIMIKENSYGKICLLIIGLVEAEKLFYEQESRLQTPQELLNAFRPIIRSWLGKEANELEFVAYRFKEEPHTIWLAIVWKERGIFYRAYTFSPDSAFQAVSVGPYRIEDFMLLSSKKDSDVR